MLSSVLLCLTSRSVHAQHGKISGDLKRLRQTKFQNSFVFPFSTILPFCPPQFKRVDNRISRGFTLHNFQVPGASIIEGRTSRGKGIWIILDFSPAQGRKGYGQVFFYAKILFWAISLFITYGGELRQEHQSFIEQKYKRKYKKKDKNAPIFLDCP